jgi:hypothetical protein
MPLMKVVMRGLLIGAASLFVREKGLTRADLPKN